MREIKFLLRHPHHLTLLVVSSIMLLLFAYGVVLTTGQLYVKSGCTITLSVIANAVIGFISVIVCWCLLRALEIIKFR